MYATPSQFVEFQKTQLDALYALSHVAFDTTEKLVDLNLAAVKASMDESAATTKALLGVKDPQELLALNGSLAQPTLEKLVGYSRNVYSIVSDAGAEVKKIVETQIAEGNGKVAQLVEFASKNAPTGSEPVVSLFKNAVAASNTAYG
ncbi:MAG TPA: phasin family protein, partial [Burkholderiaceae bacterium]|nr:phasin family protein [Burkholderiaceae bacterium]